MPLTENGLIQVEHCSWPIAFNNRALMQLMMGGNVANRALEVIKATYGRAVR